MIRNFIYASAVIMGGSCMEEVLASTIGSVDTMLSGKKYPQAVCAPRILVEEILSDVVGDTSFTGLIEELDI